MHACQEQACLKFKLSCTVCIVYMHMINIDRSSAEQKVQTVDVGVQTECKEIAVVPVLPHKNLQDQ